MSKCSVDSIYMYRNGYVWGAVLGVLIIVVAGLVIHSRVNAPTNTASSTPSTTGTTTVDLGNGQTITLPPGAKLTEYDSTSTTPTAPSLSGSIKIDSSLDPGVQTALRTQETTLISELKSNPARLDLWLQLGTDRKIAHDYTGAAEAWSYVAANKSNIQYIAYGNLGDLYMNFVKDYPKAEANYKAAIALNPQFIDYYRDLFNLYRGFYKTNTTAAADIVAQGLKANPNNPDLLQLQQQLKAQH